MEEAAVVPSAASAHEAMAIQGPYLIGWQVEIIASTVFFVLAFQYMQGSRFKRVSREVKATVWATVVLTAVITFLYVWCEVEWGVEPKRDVETLVGLKLVDCIVSLPVMLQATVVQSFLAHRATVLIQRNWLRCSVLGMLALLITGTFISTLFFDITYFYWWRSIHTPPPWDRELSIRLFLAFTAVTDVAIAVTCAMSLRSRIANFNAVTDRMLRSLSVVALQTGAVTAVLAVSGAVASLATIESLYGDVMSAFILPLPAFYALSLITNLNARSRIAALPTTAVVGGAGVKEFSIGPLTTKQQESGTSQETRLSLMVETSEAGRSMA